MTLNPAKTKILLSKFEQLKTTKQKLEFWEKELGMNYLQFLENFNSLDHLHAFRVAGFDDKQNWEECNIWVLKNYSTLSSEKQLIRYPILELKKLKKGLSEKLRTTKNQIDILYQELEVIDSSFHTKKSKALGLGLEVTTTTNHKFNADYNSYKRYLDYKKEPDYSKVYPGSATINVHNGKVLAEYRLYVSEQIDALKKGGKVKTESINLTIKQWALYFYYQELLDKVKQDKVYLARVLAPVIEKNEKDFYDALRLVEGKKDKKDIQKLIEYCEVKGLNDLKKVIEADIKKTTKKA